MSLLHDSLNRLDRAVARLDAAIDAHLARTSASPSVPQAGVDDSYTSLAHKDDALGATVGTAGALGPGHADPVTGA